MFVCCVVCLPGRGLCDGLITRREESYRLWCVLVCDLETSKMRRLKPASGLSKPVEEEEEEEEEVINLERPKVIYIRINAEISKPTST